jgi:hypothetical protein
MELGNMRIIQKYFNIGWENRGGKNEKGWGKSWILFL